MIDKKIEENIKMTKRFLEFWSKFHELYRHKEEDFIYTRPLVNSRFQDLMDLIGIKQSERAIRAYHIYEILSIDNFSEMSDDKLEKIDDNWTDSYVYLSSLLNRFQRKKRKIEKFNKLIYVMKGLTRRRRMK